MRGHGGGHLPGCWEVAWFIGLWVGAAYTETFSFMSLCGLGEQICAALDVAF